MTTGLNLELANAIKNTDTIGEIVTGMRKTINEINDQAESARQFWKGQGNTAFEKAAIDWQEEGARLNKRLDELESTLRSGYKKYDTHDDEVASDFQNLSGSLNL